MRHRMIGAGLMLAVYGGSVPGLAAEEPGLGIEEALLAVRQEMEKVKSVGKKPGKPPYFSLKEATLRIQFVMSRETGPDGTPRMKILPVEVGHDYPAAAVHTLTLQLERPQPQPASSRRPRAVPRRRRPAAEPKQQPQERPQPEPAQEPQPEPEQQEP